MFIAIVAKYATNEPVTAPAYDNVENFIKSVETIRILLWDKEKGILNNLNENYNLEISLDEYFKNYRNSYNVLKAAIKKQTIGITDNILIVQDNEFSAITKNSKITNNITCWAVIMI